MNRQERITHSIVVALPVFILALFACSTVAFAQGGTVPQDTVRKASDTSGTKVAQKPEPPIEVEPQPNMEQIYSRLRYPEEARRNNIHGRVVVRVLIDKTGKVVTGDIMQSAHPLLDEAAMAAVIGTDFKPALMNGVATACWVAIPIEFELKGSGGDEEEE